VLYVKRHFTALGEQFVHLAITTWIRVYGTLTRKTSAR
jgi:hypothetical protein